MLSSWGLRSRLVLLVGVALTPVFGLFGWVSADNQATALRLAQARLQSDALLVAAHQQPLVESAKQLLGDIANSATVQNKQADLCGDYLRSLQALQPAYAGLGVAATDGTVICNSRPMRVGINASAHPLFKRVLVSRQFEIGDYGAERSIGKAGVGFVMPVYSPTGVLSAVAFTAVDVHAFSAALAEVTVDAGVSVSLTDRKGTILATHPADSALVGTVQRDAAVRRFLQDPQTGTDEALDAEGHRRLYAFAPVPGAASGALFVVVSMPRALIAAKSWHVFVLELVVLLGTALFGMGCAWWMGRRLIVAPVQAILHEANELAVGNLAARVEVGPVGQGELGHLARTFNRMAESLQLRQGELDGALARIGKEHDLLELIINSMSEGVIAADVDGRFLLFNAAAKKLFPAVEAGTTLTDWREHHTLISPDGQTIYTPHDRPLSRAIRGESIDNWDLQLRSEKSGDRVLRMNLRPLRNQGQALIGGLVVFTDITERQLADQELARTNRALKMLNRCNEALTRMDDEAGLLQQVCRLAVDVGGYQMAWVGYAQDDAKRSILPMAHAGHEAGYLSTIQLSWDAEQPNGRGPAGQAIRSGQAKVSEDITRGANHFHWPEEAARRGYRSAVVLPLRDSRRTFGLLALYSASVEKLADDEIKLLQELADNLAFGIGNVRSRLERQQAQAEILRLNAGLEERVRQRTAELQMANQELEAFSYSVSHDLRTPLSAIDGFSGLLEKDFNEGSAVSDSCRHYLSRIRAGVAQMGELIDALLSLARVSRISLRWDRADLSAMANAVLSGYREREPDRKVQLAIAPNLRAQGDPRLLQQVLENLLGNAWKFSSKQPQARITFGCARGPDGQAVYAVHDNGAGFDMTYADKLFGAFQRLHTVTEFAGTGVGLATVHRIITRHGGRVWAESAPGQGATFYFTLGQAPGLAQPVLA
ncbi:ATP-binding protein [Polaromonas sp. SM01]|uniref:ATP-binding protein n=1 Tax=Polaromonas sp. SM01 TaxID=3085630 RepID=UPI0029814BA5|nr:ATP-binding protein [Polaromonas sp. SM01]MDW5441352.1 ATP-binding protein [Polaromonas sp. SM01]